MMDDIGDELQAEIMNEIRKRYSATVIGHWQQPRNWGIMGDADGYGKVTGPCGDTIEISVQVKDRTIQKCTFDTDGCGTTIACASIITEMVTGKTVIEARRINESGIIEFCGGLPDDDRHCALLAANTLQKALDDYDERRSEAWKKYYAR
ncbi:iron-sulfur cluster assembly scaffold protein [candidate division WOR-3 bacterium]|nr:iron-sulfur cluster assembly scaffold protein [candidate division WOR-3 bacterium]